MIDTKMKYILILITLFAFFLPNNVKAFSCYMPWGQELIDQHSLIVEGVAIKTGENKGAPGWEATYTTFKVTKIYKGSTEDEVNIYYGTKGQHPLGGGIEPYHKGDTYILFPTKDEKSGLYNVNLCSRGLDLKAIRKNPKNYHYPQKTVEELEKLYLQNTIQK